MTVALSGGPSAIAGAVLITGDPSDVVPFYEGLFGWDVGSAAAGVTTFTRAGVAEALAVSTATEVAGWLPIIQVADLSRVQEAVRASAGAVRTITEGMTLLEDPLGARCLVVEPGDSVLSDLRSYDPDQSEVGALSWCQLNSREAHRSAEFYDAVFGWTLGPSDNDKFTYWRFYNGQPLAHAGLMAVDERSGTEVPGIWQIYFHGDDQGAMAHRLGELAGSVLVQPTEIVSGSFLVASDPCGHLFGIDHMTHGPVGGVPR